MMHISKKMMIGILFIFMLTTSMIPCIYGFNLKDIAETELISSFDLDYAYRLTFDENISFDDYADDVICYDIDSLTEMSMYRTKEYPHLNIITAELVQKNDQVTVMMQVEGIIENQGNLSFDENISDLDTIQYAFRIRSSHRNYSVIYCNNTCELTFDNNSIPSDFELNTSTLQVRFQLNDTRETIQAFEVATFDLYVDLDLFEMEFSQDLASPIDYPMQIQITKPAHHLYLFNKKILLFPLPVIIGSIDVEYTEVINETDTQYRELYIDGELTATPNLVNNHLSWNDVSFGKHTLEILVFDYYGNRAADEIEVWKFF